MIVILKPNLDQTSDEYYVVRDYLQQLPNIDIREHQEHGTQQILTEFYLIGDTAALNKDVIASLPGVERVVRIYAVDLCGFKNYIRISAAQEKEKSKV